MEASPPKILPGALASLLKLAQTADLYLITQLPHSGCKELTEYFEQHTVPSELSPHGVWQDDKMELAVLKVRLTSYRKLNAHHPRHQQAATKRWTQNLKPAHHETLDFCSQL